MAIARCIQDAACLTALLTRGAAAKSAQCVALGLANAYRQLEREGVRLGAGLLRLESKISQSIDS